jgi:hypothetical protein
LRIDGVKKRHVMNGLTYCKAEQARAWDTGKWQNIAASVLPVVDKEHVARLATRTEDRWHDVAAGTEAVALPAARAAAEGSALDRSPALVRTARRTAAEQGLSPLAAVHRHIRAGQDRSRSVSPVKRETVRRGS